MFYEKRGKQFWRRMMAGMLALAFLLLAFGANNRPQPTTINPDENEVVHLDPEFAYGSQVYTTFISGFEVGVPFTNRQVQYTIADGLPIYEGDIILDLNQPALAGTGLPSTKFYWTNNLVPYEIDARLPEQWRVTDAIKHWEEKTSIRFVLRTKDNAKQYPNYVAFVPGAGCSSYVGMIGGRQTVNLALGCSLGNTIHEIGHVVGLWHEQSRADRDNHVTIKFENIIPSMAFNFDKHITDGEDIGNYDYSSIMHYPRKAFSKNGEDTIVPNGDQPIGQRDRLSEGDIGAVEYMYGKISKDTMMSVDTSIHLSSDLASADNSEPFSCGSDR